MVGATFDVFSQPVTTIAVAKTNPQELPNTEIRNQRWKKQQNGEIGFE